MEERKKTIIFIFLSFCALFMLIIGKAFRIQVIDKNELQVRYQKQILREVKVYPRRGNILDRNGEPLALNIQTYSIFTIPKHLKNYKDLNQISQIIPNLDYSNLKKEIKERNKFTWIARKISLNESQLKLLKDIKGVYVEPVPKRLYPNNELLAQTIGFVGVDNVGLSGLEHFYDKELRGTPKTIKYIKDAKGRPVKYETGDLGNTSKDIQLSIDKDLQAIAEKYLKDVVIDSNAEKAGIGVLDADTGEVLAIANYPTFDPNKFTGADANSRKLSFISDPFEPGSTFKVITVAAALENKIAKPETNYYCDGGKLLVDGHLITEAESRKKFEWLSVEEILKYSSNVGTSKIAFDLTYPRLKEMIELFQFGEKTGIEIPGESRGIYNSKENVTPLRLSNISFGQGVAATGIQMLAAYGAIANGGEYIIPTILKRDPNKIERKRILSKKTAAQVTDMLVKAVEHGTGGNAHIPYFEIAGKTSTAQRPNVNGGYSGYVAGFVGFPTNATQKFVIYVYVDNPQGKYYGNQIAAPVFKKVAQYILYKDEGFEKLSVKEGKEEQKDQVQIINSSTVKRYFGQGLVPNFSGLDKRSARKLADKWGLKLIHKGIGIVNEQFPGAGAALKDGGAIKLMYSPPEYD